MMGVRVERVFTNVFVLGAMLAALAGALLGPLLAVQIGMGEDILILALVVIVIGGIGSVRGAFVASLLVGMVDISGARLPAGLAETGHRRTAGGRPRARRCPPCRCMC